MEFLSTKDNNDDDDDNDSKLGKSENIITGVLYHNWYYPEDITPGWTQF